VTRHSKLGLFVAVALSTTVLAGCSGQRGSLAPRDGPVNSNLVSESNIRAMPPHSPQRALLRWWRDLQYENITGYFARLAGPLRRKRLRSDASGSYVVRASGALIPTKPTIVRATTKGNRATIFTRIETRHPVGESRTYTTSFPQSFVLRNNGAGWQLADDTFVMQRAG